MTTDTKPAQDGAISELAKRAFQEEAANCREGGSPTAGFQSGHFIQAAINEATAALRKERDEAYRHVCKVTVERDDLTADAMALRETVRVLREDSARLDRLDALGCAIIIHQDTTKADSSPKIREGIDKGLAALAIHGTKGSESPDAAPGRPV
jgi:hypothetical protein